MLAVLRVLSGAIGLTAALPLGAMAQTPPSNRITTAGTGEVRLAPDWATITFSVAADDSSAFAAASAGTAVTQRVVAALEGVGLAGDSLVRVSFSVGPLYNWSEGRQLLGYRGEASIRVDVRQLGQLAKIIDAALAAGATGVSGLQFRSNREEEARVEALKQAVAKARSDAEVLVVATGTRLGKAIRVRTGRDSGPLFEAYQVRGYMGSAAPDLTPRDVVIYAEVEIDWELLVAPR
jgi:uncharacterized protein YggE